MKNRIIQISTLVFLYFFGLLIDVSAKGSYAVIKLNGSVNPIIAEYIVASIERANKEKANFIVLQMDTPGGLMTSMREIIKAIMSSEIPVVVYTYPKGAQAASAGGYIMISAHVAAMAPGTEIGAMHPVSPMLDFGTDEENKKKGQGVMEKKVLNDTIAYARSLAQKRNRNISWTERAVKDAISSTYIEAKKLGVIDIIAEDMDDLLAKLNGMKVNVNNKIIILNTDKIKETTYELNWKEEFLNFFADPQVVFFLFIIAIVGIGMEFKSPGMIVPGVVGAISFIIFLMAIRVLPINFAGLFLIIVAIVLFILELKFTSYGLLTVGGIISFVIGSMILFDSPLPGFGIPIATIVGVVLFLLVFILGVIRSILKAHAEKVTTGKQGLIGESGIAIRDFDQTGKILVHGEIWTARSQDEIKKNDRLIVEDLDGMVLIVKKI